MLASGPPPHLPGFLNSLTGPLDHFGYWAVLLQAGTVAVYRSVRFGSQMSPLRRCELWS